MVNINSKELIMTDEEANWFEQIVNDYVLIDTNGHWIWLRGKDGKGYGVQRFRGKDEKASRLSYVTYVADIPKGLQINHRCKNQRDCIRPEHLYLGTHSQNQYDSVKDKTHVSNQQRKLTDNQVKQIKWLYHADGETYKEIARQFNVSISTINGIINGRTYRST